MEEKGLFLINTGNGKGKSTAAFGLALRMAGHGGKVCIIQFIKAQQQTGEAKAIRQRLADLIELHVTGSGFTWKQSEEEVRAAAKHGWQLARDKVQSEEYDLIVLDELTYLMNYNLIAESEVLALIADRPERLNIVITGRNASAGLVAAADLVTEMTETKHPYQNGIIARKGLEF